jgi:hypothetical protein
MVDSTAGQETPTGARSRDQRSPSPSSLVDDDAARARDTSRVGETRERRLALVAFVIVEVVAFLVFVHFGRRSWFHFDDWDFLAGRTAGSPHSLFAPRNEHWSTVPVLTYRVLWDLFGLRFTPYLIIAVALHLTAAALLRVVMRRAGVGPWIATGAAALYALFGVGYQSELQLFALQFSGWAIVFGLTYLILVDHDGPFDRRDWLGVAAGICALASSLVGVAMVIAVVGAAFLRRGARVALAHLLSLLAIFALWYALYGESTTGADLGGIRRWVPAATRELFEGLGQSTAAAIGLGLLLVVGLTLAWSRLPRQELRVRASMPVGLLLGAVVFLIATGYGRGTILVQSFRGGVARDSHYLDVAAAMVLPALAVAADAVARRLPVPSLVVALVFVIGIPGNITALDDGATRLAGGAPNNLEMLSLPRAPLAREAARSLVPEPILASQVTIGWLRSGVASGRIPPPAPHAPPGLAGQLELRLSLQQLNRSLDRGAVPCNPLRGPVVRALRRGQHLRVRHGSVYVQLFRDHAWTPAVQFGEPFAPPAALERTGETLLAVRGPLTVQVTPLLLTGAVLCP